MWSFFKDLLPWLWPGYKEMLSRSPFDRLKEGMFMDEIMSEAEGGCCCSFSKKVKEDSLLEQEVYGNTRDVKYHDAFMNGKEAVEERWKTKEKETAWNVYMDFRKPFRKATLVFVAQLGLFAYYVYELNGGDGDDSPGFQSHDPANASFTKWMFALCIIEISGDEEVGPSFGIAFWKNKLQRLKLLPSPETESGKICGFEVPVGWTRLNKNFGDRVCMMRMSPRIHVLLRLVMDFVINSLARSIIRGTAPIMLCVEGPLDFIKDVTAVFFILKLDDIDEDKDLTAAEAWDFTSTENDYEIYDFTDSAYRVPYLRNKCKLAKASEVREYIVEKNNMAKEDAGNRAQQAGNQV